MIPQVLPPTAALPRAHHRIDLRGLTAALTIAAFAPFALRFVLWSVRVLGFPYPVDYGEGAVLDAALRLARLQNIYPADLSSPPWFVTNYPPLFFAIQVPFVLVFGPALWYGRLIEQLAAIVTALLIARTIRAVTADRTAGAIAGLVFLSMPFVAMWAQYDRVDLLALSLNWAGISFIVCGRDARVAPAVICFLASSFTRQTGAAAGLAAACCWLWAREQFRPGARLMSWLAASAAAIVAFLNLTTHGGFVFNVVTATRGRMSTGQLLDLAREVVNLIPWFLVVLAVVAMAALWRRPQGWSLVTAYSVVAVGLSAMAAKEGSYINYFLDLCAACALAAGAGVAWLRRLRRHADVLSGVLMIALLLQAWRIAKPNATTDHLAARLERRAEYAHLLSIVRNTSGRVLADEPMALLPLTGRTIEVQPFAMTQLARTGLWDESRFVDEIEGSQYELVLLRMVARNPVPLPNLWDTRMAGALERTYRPAETVRVDETAYIAVCRPGGRPGPATAPGTGR